MIVKQTVLKLYKDIEQAIDAIAEKHGLAISFANAKFSAEHARLNFDVFAVVNGNVKSPEAIAFEKRAALWGLAPSDLGIEFMFNGRAFILTGYLSKGKKYKFQAKTSDTGHVFRLPVSAVQAIKAAKEAKASGLRTDSS